MVKKLNSYTLKYILQQCSGQKRKAVLQAGTLSGNPLAMTAGIKTLEILDRPGVYEYLDKITGRLINGILDAGRAAGHSVCGGHINGEGTCDPPLPPCI